MLQDGSKKHFMWQPTIANINQNVNNYNNKNGNDSDSNVDIDWDYEFDELILCIKNKLKIKSKEAKFEMYQLSDNNNEELVDNGDCLECVWEELKDKYKEIQLEESKSDLFEMLYTRPVDVSSVQNNINCKYNNDVVCETESKENGNDRYKITKALVLIICISKYNKLDNVESVKVDMKNMKHLWENKFNYHVITNDATCTISKAIGNNDINSTSEYFVDESILYEKTDEARRLLRNKKNKFDAFIFIYSGHGYQNGIITSKNERVKLDDIEKQFSPKFVSNFKDCPKIFIMDTCRSYCHGNYNYNVLAMDKHERYEKYNQLQPLSNMIEIYSVFGCGQDRHGQGINSYSYSGSLIGKIFNTFSKYIETNVTIFNKKTFQQLLNPIKKSMHYNEYGNQRQILKIEETLIGIDVFISPKFESEESKNEALALMKYSTDKEIGNVLQALSKIIETNKRVEKYAISTVTNIAAEWLQNGYLRNTNYQVASNLELIGHDLLMTQSAMDVCVETIEEITKLFPDNYNIEKCDIWDKIKSTCLNIRNSALKVREAKLKFLGIFLLLQNGMTKVMSRLQRDELTVPADSLTNTIDYDEIEEVAFELITSVHDMNKLIDQNMKDCLRGISGDNSLKYKFDALREIKEAKKNVENDLQPKKLMCIAEKALVDFILKKKERISELETELKKAEDVIKAMRDKYKMSHAGLMEFFESLSQLQSTCYNTIEQIERVKENLKRMADVLSPIKPKPLTFAKAIQDERLMEYGKLNNREFIKTLAWNGFEFCHDLACDDKEKFQFMVEKLNKEAEGFKDEFGSDRRFMRKFQQFCVRKPYKDIEKWHFDLFKNDVMQDFPSLIEFFTFYYSKSVIAMQILKEKKEFDDRATL